MRATLRKAVTIETRPTIRVVEGGKPSGFGDVTFLKWESAGPKSDGAVAKIVFLGQAVEKHPLLELFDKWDSEPDSQTAEDWENLKKLLDEDRPSGRKLFPGANPPT